MNPLPITICSGTADTCSTIGDIGKPPRFGTNNYNSYPQAPEVMLEPDGTLRLLRKRQSLDQMLANEV